MGKLNKIAVCLLASALVTSSQNAEACDFLSGVPCEKVDEIKAYRAKLFDDVKSSHGKTGSEARATDLVQSVALLSRDYHQKGSQTRHYDYSTLPKGTSVADVSFTYDSPNKGDREIRITLKFPKSFINSEDFNQFNISKIGAEFMASLAEEDFNRTFLYVIDPVSGKAVDVQNLLPEDVAPIDKSKKEIEDYGLAPKPSGPIAQKAIVPSINNGQPSGALSGKTVYINQSHGWFDDYTSSLNRYRVQRGDNFGVLEDFDSAEFINLWVLPALRNAGAKVQTVRESDLQTNMVIVDNADGTSGNPDGTYVETGTWSNSSLNGFVQKTTSSWNGTSVNPFNQGSGENRLSSGLSSSTPTATATWTADIPEDGYYNVYASWTSFSARADDAQYLIHHSGGVSEVNMDQTIDGYTWNLLGNYYFEAGAPASERKVVLTNVSSDGTASNVSADAIRWGGGMSDVARHTNGVSGRPRWEEEAVLYLQFNGFGYSGTLYSGSDDESGGWADRPQYARWEHSQKDGSVEDAVYFAWHTNAFNGSARGLSTFRHSTATAASTDLQTIMHDTLYDHIEGQWFPGWTVRSKNVTNFGENNQSSLGTGLPGFLFEGLFHDNATDAGGYSEPEFRYAAARGIVDGLISYFEDRDSITLTRPPETPTNFAVEAIGSGQATLSWDAPPNSSSDQYLGDAATSYIVYESPNGFGFDDGTAVSGTSTTISGLSSGDATYFRIAAVNSGGQSFPTETLVACDGTGNVLIVNGFDRNSASLVPEETITNAGTDLQRLDPRNFQAFNYAVEHAEALQGTGVSISSASNEAVLDSSVDLDDYEAVFWISGEESTVDETFSSSEQSLVTSYLATSGNNLFVSGAELGWDLGRSTRPQADQDFYNDDLRATYVGDDSGTYSIADPTSGPFSGLSSFNFNPSSGARYDAQFPDRLGTSGGSSAALTYSGGTNDTAAIYYNGSSKVINLGFPFETISSESVRADMMQDTIDFFGISTDSTPPSAPSGLAATGGDGSVSLDWSNNSEGDLDGYNVYRSTTSGSGYTKLNGSLLASSDYTDNSVSNFTTYYYVVTAVDDSSNESSNSSEDSATPEDVTAPSAPTGLVATAGDATVSLDWNNNGEGDLDGYNVYRSTTSGSGYSQLNGSLLTSSDYTDNSVTNGTTYYYVVTAVDDTPNANESGNSSEDSATPASPILATAIDFDDYTVSGFGGQDVDSTSWQKQDSGHTMYLSGNTWKVIPLNYTVTSNTVVDFEYRSTGNEPEIGGINFDNDLNLSATQTFKVYGTQAYGNTTYDNYSPSGWTSYSIPVGSSLTAGSYTYFGVLNDHDGGSGSNSYFRNVIVYDTENIYDNDNGSPEYTTTGSWFTSGSSGYNGGTYQYATSGGSHTATWDLEVPAPGSWEVEVMFRASGNRSDSVEYEISHAGGTSTVYRDQTINNLVWVSLGTYSFDGDDGTVTLDAAGSSTPGVVITDAVRITKQ